MQRGIPAISVEPYTSAQAWKFIEKDYTLRLSLVAHEWAEVHLKAWNAVSTEGRKRGNSAYSGPALVEMEIADAEKRAEWSYRTCCEIWEIQGRTPSRPFFRAIFDFGLQSMFSAREGSFKHRLELHQRRTSLRIPQGLPVICGSLKQGMARLLARWNTKLEIATRDAEHQERLLREREMEKLLAADDADDAKTRPMNALYRAFEDSQYEQLKWLFSGTPQADKTEGAQGLPGQVGNSLSVFTWKELETRFREIQLKLSVHEKVSAEFTRTEWDSGSVDEEWRIRGSSVRRAEFERLAIIAARKLGYAGEDETTSFWLCRVREWLQLTGLDKDKALAWCPTGCGEQEGRAYKTLHLNSERIAELSAMFCLELIARGAPESIVGQGPEQSEMTERETGSHRAVRKTPKNKKPPRRKAVIFGVIQLGLKGPKYCAALDERKVRPPDRWIDEGCHSTYAQAYRDAGWRKRIQDEKCRYRKEYEKTSARERKAIIEGEGVTRHTRN